MQQTILVVFALLLAPAAANANPYNPQINADKDSRMVDSLLDAVAGFGGSKRRKIAALRQSHQKVEKVESPLDADAAMLGLDEEDTTQASEAAPVQAVVAPTEGANPYLTGLDLGGGQETPADAAPIQHTAHKAHKAHTKAKAHKDGENLLATFSFDDDSTDDAAALADDAAHADEAVPAAAPKVNNAFLNYLGMPKKAAAPEESLLQEAEAPDEVSA